MRRTLSTLSTLMLLAAAVPASAQMPPSIRGPIDAAKRQASKTSAQINEEQKIGNDQGTKAAAPKPAQATAKAQAGSKTAAKTAAKPGAKAPVSVSQNGTKGAVTFYREVFSYSSDGRRDPFVSLMATGELRPLLSDLTLVGIIYDESGRNSVAILVDASAGGQTYRKKVGESLGRIKVTRITDKDVTLDMDQFGFDRQETLLIDRDPRTARRPQ
ncbi:MAG TPA: hypothetical protein VN613_07160 [Gemmatimonadaceae bacterium]|nr:hypothetical protein [Gemmatimonadaceae bacterium]